MELEQIVFGVSALTFGATLAVTRHYCDRAASACDRILKGCYNMEEKLDRRHYPK